MRIERTGLVDVLRIDLEPASDARGFFARTWCEREIGAALGQDAPAMVQASAAFNHAPGTLRGMHFTVRPSHEWKLVRCVRGAIHDVLLDTRPGSSSYLRHQAWELSADNRCALLVPPGVAHGYLTLTADTEVHYQMSEFFEPSYARGVRWNDPAFGITWPGPVKVINDRDRDCPDFDPAILVPVASRAG